MLLYGDEQHCRAAGEHLLRDSMSLQLIALSVEHGPGPPVLDSNRVGRAGDKRGEQQAATAANLTHLHHRARDTCSDPLSDTVRWRHASNRWSLLGFDWRMRLKAAARYRYRLVVPKSS